MIAVFGATGRLGRPLVGRLAAAGHRVRAIARHGDALSSFDATVETATGDVCDPRTLAPALVGVDVVVSAVTGFGGPGAGGSRAVDWLGNVNLIRAAERAGVGHFVLLSATGASGHHPIELFRMKHRAEEALRASALSWTILRPAAYAELWLEMLGRPLVEKGRTRVFGRGRNPINFVSVEDVAAFVELAIADARLRDMVVEAPGPENLSFDELLAPVQAIAQGRIDHVSPRTLRLLERFVRPFNPILAAQIASAIVLDERDLTVDPSVRSAYAVPVTSVREVATRMFGEGEPRLTRAA